MPKVERARRNQERVATQKLLAKLDQISRGITTRVDIDNVVSQKYEHRRREYESVSNVIMALKQLKSPIIKKITESEHYSPADESGKDLLVSLKNASVHQVSVQIKSSQESAERFIREQIENCGLSKGVSGSTQSPLIRRGLIVLCGTDDPRVIRQNFKEQLRLIEEWFTQNPGRAPSGSHN